MRQVSAKRRKQATVRARVVEQVRARAGGRCEAQGRMPELVCAGTPCAHEVVQRSVRPGSELEPDLCVWVCHVHHMAVHDQVERSLANGLLRHSWDVDDLGQLKPLDGAA